MARSIRSLTRRGEIFFQTYVKSRNGSNMIFFRIHRDPLDHWSVKSHTTGLNFSSILTKQCTSFNPAHWYLNSPLDQTHPFLKGFYLTQNQAKILILKGLNRRRSTPWDWGIILILFWFGVWFCWLDGIIITPSCVLKMFNRGMPTLVQWTIHDVLHAYVSWLWRGSSLVKMHDI